MKLENWENVVFSWMNSWNFTEEPVVEIGALLNREFYSKLFNELGKDTTEIDDETPLPVIIESFLKDECYGFDINGSQPWSEQEIVFTTSLVLLSASLKSHNLRTPLFQLHSGIQLAIQAFFQKLMSKPPQEVTNDVLFEAITEISSDDENDSIDRPRTPLLRLNSHFQETPEYKRHESSKLKSLQCKLDLSEWEKQHLIEEMEFLKNDLEELKKKYNIKEHDVLKLESELYMRENEGEETNEVVVQAKYEEKRLKDQIAELEISMEAMRTDMYRALTTNSNLESQLERSEAREEECEKKCIELETKVDVLNGQIEDLECLVSNLKQTNKEQSEMLLERRNNRFNDSVASMESYGESLVPVVELKYIEAEEQISILRAELDKLTQQKKDLETIVEDLQKKAKEQEAKEDEDLLKVKNKLTESLDKVEELKEENDFLASTLEDKKMENELLRKDLEVLKTSDLMSEVSDRRSSLDSGLRTEMEPFEGSHGEKLINEIAHLNSLLDGKQFILDETKGLVNKLKRELGNRDRDMSSLTDDLSYANVNLAKKQHKISELEEAVVEKTMEIESLKDQLSKSQCDNSFLKNKLRSVELEAENLIGDLRVKGTTLMALEQNLNMYDHEKAIMERRINFLKGEADKVDELKSEVRFLKQETSSLAEEITLQKLDKERLKAQIEENHRSNDNLDNKLAILESKMKDKYEMELQKTVDSYNTKLNQMKKKMMKDKSHIEELSSDLWETSDRYLLASQESKALRNQLQRTKAALEVLTNPRNPSSVQMSNPCLWLDDDHFDERLIYTKEIYGKRYSLNSNAVQDLHQLDEEELFNDSCLEDLKAGVCRLPNQRFVTSRASYPIPRTPDSSLGKTNDRQSLLPNERPKKVKNTINYSRPGPPTPVRNRLSLQGLDKLDRMVVKEEKVVLTRESQAPRRLSRFFNRPNPKKPTQVCPMPESQTSPKAKRKSFFQRKFGNNRENIPPN